MDIYKAIKNLFTFAFSANHNKPSMVVPQCQDLLNCIMIVSKLRLFIRFVPLFSFDPTI